ncbi:MAG: MaoC family dehydratase [bacterium]|nr:MaoC family dehydratase [bacterium]
MAERPELVYDDLGLGRRFPEFRYETTPELVEAFVAATGDDNPAYTDGGAARALGLEWPVVPPGLAGIWGRQAYLQEHRMPPGGILAGQDMVFSRPVAVGDALRIQAEVTRRWEHKGRRFVTIESTARAASSDEVCGIVRVTAIWPK